MTYDAKDLKAAMLDYLRFRETKYPNDSFGIGGKAYSVAQVIKEIKADSSLGKEMVSDMVKLTIDLVGRGKKQGDKLRSSGITVDQIYNSSDLSWYTTVAFSGDGDLFIKNRFNGEIYTKEPNSLPGAIDRIMEIAKGFGIKFRVWGNLPRLNYGDFKLNPPPDGWREMLQSEAERIGFVSLYGSTEEATLGDLLVAQTEEDFLDM